MNTEERDNKFLTDENNWVAVFDAFGIEKSAAFTLNPSGPRVLTLCRGGNTRSAAIAFLLKYKYKLDALAASLEKNSALTLELLGVWADYILVTELPHYHDLCLAVPSIRGKLHLLDLGLQASFRVNPYEIEWLKQVDATLRPWVEERILWKHHIQTAAK
jgi:hypothetical protein